MNVAVVVSDSEVTNVIIGNGDEFLSKVRAWYAECALEWISTKEDAEWFVDPAEATLTQITHWWNSDNSDNALYFFENIQNNPTLEQVPETLRQLREEVVNLLATSEVV